MQQNRLFVQALRGGLAAGALALTVGTGIVLADQQKPESAERAERAEHGKAALAHRHAAVGVLAADASGGALDKLTFTVTTKHGDLKVSTDADTKFRLREDEDVAVKVTDLTKGARVQVEGQRQQDGTLLARHVLVGGKTEHEAKAGDKAAALTRTEGTVSQITDKTVVVQPTTAGAAAVTFNLTAKTHVSLVGATQLKTGQKVTIVTKAGSADALLIRANA